MDDGIENRLLPTKQTRIAIGGCSEMHLWRLLHNERYADLRFPKPIQIGGRNYWRANEVNAWIEEQAKKPSTKRRRPGPRGEAA